jgi:uncharacterized protein (UPF0335 family)
MSIEFFRDVLLLVAIACLLSRIERCEHNIKVIVRESAEVNHESK